MGERERVSESECARFENFVACFFEIFHPAVFAFHHIIIFCMRKDVDSSICICVYTRNSIYREKWRERMRDWRTLPRPELYCDMLDV